MNSYLQYIEFTLGLLLVLTLDRSFAQTYKAAVVAYKPERKLSDLPFEIRNRSKEKYIHLMGQVRDRADIIIFPEYGLTTNEPNSKPRVHLDSDGIVVPDPPTNPCFSNADQNELAGISCAAKTYGIYVVLNVIEKIGENEEEMKFYSTNVVLDPEGKLILKCRKKYPFNDTHFDKGDERQECVFDAKFKNNNNVRFTVLFDTDLVHERKENINNVILTSSIKNVLPITSGLSLQVGYSVGNKVNLLASGYVDLDHGYGGSGIYLQNGTSKVAVNSDIIIAEIPIKETVTKEINVNVKPSSELPSPAFYNSIGRQYFDVLNDTKSKTNFHFDNDNFCEFETNFGGNDIKPYKWVAVTGTVHYLGQDIRLLVCGLIKPEYQKSGSSIIRDLNIITKFSSSKVIQLLPISLQANMLPANFQFVEDKDSSSKKVKMSLTKEADLFSFGIVVVLRDGKPSSSSSIHASHICTVRFLSMFLVLWYGKKFIFSL